MNNKEKQIEEMAKVICQECLTATEEKYCQNEVKDCMAYEYAKLFYNAGYTQKVKDDEIVLSISEVEEFRKDQAEVKFLKKQIQEETRKETAREILQEIKQRIYDREIEAERILRYIKMDELAEKYEVE